jgi:membrane protease YdiL (CAAX protease family)
VTGPLLEGTVGRSLLLYLPFLALLGLSSWQPALSWLAPLALLLLLVGAVWLWHSEGRGIRDLGLQGPRRWWGHLLAGLAIGLVLPMALLSLLALGGAVGLERAEPAGSLFLPILTGALRAVVQAALLVAVEEVVFRGYYLQRFLVLGTWPAVLLSAALFALAHLPEMLFSGIPALPLAIGLVSWLIFGAALGVGFLRTGRRLWLPYGLHYAYNLGFGLVAVVGTACYNAPVVLSYSGPAWWVGYARWAPETGLAGLLLEIAILAAVWGSGALFSRHPITGPGPS